MVRPVKRQREEKMGWKAHRQTSRTWCTKYIFQICGKQCVGKGLIHGENKAAVTERNEMAQKSQQNHYL